MQQQRVIIVGVVVALFTIGCRGSTGDGKPRPASQTMTGLYGVADALEQVNTFPESKQPYSGALFLTKESGESEKVVWWGLQCRGLMQVSREHVQLLADAVRDRAWVTVEFEERQPGIKCLTGFTIFNR